MLEQELERVANALERVVELGGRLVDILDHPRYTAPGGEAAPIKAGMEPEKVAGGAEPSAEEAKRETIKKQLGELGIKYKEGARTATLESLLAAALAPVGGETKPATRDEMKNALLTVAEQKGKAEAFAILKAVAGVERVSETPEDKFGAVVAACEEALNG